jgi:hypothetical protein
MYINFQTPVDIQPSAPVSVSLQNTNLPPAELVNPSSQTGLVHHSLNISDPPKAVQISAKPLQFDILSVFIGFGQKPTASSHQWNFTLPKMINDSVGENFTITESAYSITLSAKSIQNVLNTMTAGNTTNDTSTQAPSSSTATVIDNNSTDSSNGSFANTLYVGIKRDGK